jgi:hypothetical protein
MCRFNANKKALDAALCKPLTKIQSSGSSRVTQAESQENAANTKKAATMIAAMIPDMSIERILNVARRAVNTASTYSPRTYELELRLPALSALMEIVVSVF